MRVKTKFDFAQRWRIIKLKPAETVRRKRFRIIAGFTLFLIIGVIGGFPWYYSLLLEERVEQINLEIMSYKDVDLLLQQESDLEKRIISKQEELSEIKSSELHPREVLEDFGQKLPAGSSIQRVDFKGDNTLSIDISVPGTIDVARLWVSLRNSGLSVSNIDRVSLSDERQSFELQFRLK